MRDASINGVFLCRLDELDATGARGIELGEPEKLDIVVVQDGENIGAYVNSCPHQGAPLEMMPDRFLDVSRKFMICTAHGARFRVEDGHCTSGPCEGEAMKMVEIRIVNGAIYLKR